MPHKYLNNINHCYYYCQYCYPFIPLPVNKLASWSVNEAQTQVNRAMVK